MYNKYIIINIYKKKLTKAQEPRGRGGGLCYWSLGEDKVQIHLYLYIGLFIFNYNCAIVFCLGRSHFPRVNKWSFQYLQREIIVQYVNVDDDIYFSNGCNFLTRVKSAYVLIMRCVDSYCCIQL